MFASALAKVNGNTGKGRERGKGRDFLWISSAFRVASAPIVSAVLSVSVVTCY